LGKDHQARYLAIREKRIRDLEENAHVYGGAWADQIKNELVELEMRYIVHVMDGRQM
jgi:sporulation-control protein spo0M